MPQVLMLSPGTSICLKELKDKFPPGLGRLASQNPKFQEENIPGPSAALLRQTLDPGGRLQNASMLECVTSRCTLVPTRT